MISPHKKSPIVPWSMAALALFPVAAMAAGADGRIFLPTPDAVAIYELNELGVPVGQPLATGSRLRDLSGNGLDAIVLANEAGALLAGDGDPAFHRPPNQPEPSFRNTQASKLSDSDQHPRLAVDHHGEFEMSERQDFTVELYVERRSAPSAIDWGVLAGTWHSRNGPPPESSQLWYGWGLIRYAADDGWMWIMSPISPDGTAAGGFNEVKGQIFKIPEGRHYVVGVWDRTDQSASTYLDGEPVGKILLDPSWSFITPTGRTPARFSMFSGEDDAERGAFRGSPAGYNLDAVRVQKKALSAAEVKEIYTAIQNGQPSPAPRLQAILIAPELLMPFQCALLDGTASLVESGRTIAKYEWKVGDAPFEEDQPAREIFFQTPTDGVDVQLRITDSSGDTSTASRRIRVVYPNPMAVITATNVGGQGPPLHGDPLRIPRSSFLQLDATKSLTGGPAGALSCPLSGGDELHGPPIASYEWDVDGDGSFDSSEPSIILDTAVAREITVLLEVVSDAGKKGTATRRIEVVDNAGNSRVFHQTPGSVLRLELNDLNPGGPVDEGMTFADLSGNEHHLTIRNPQHLLALESGAIHFAENAALTFIGPEPAPGAPKPHGLIEEDEGAFEMGASDSFTFEIYFKPGEADTPYWGGVAGTFRARSRDPDPESQPRYGWGIIKSDQDEGYLFVLGYGAAAEPSVPFRLTKGDFSYVACVVDRQAQQASVYVNGERQGELALDPAWSFITPAGYQHARFIIFAREEKDGQLLSIIPGCSIDAVRFQLGALSAKNVADNWTGIRSGRGANPPPNPGDPLFRRGDVDASGIVDITDAIRLLGFQFLGAEAPGCFDAADSDDSGLLDITDAVDILGFLFLGQGSPRTPGPIDCGADPSADELPACLYEPPVNC